ncbi:MAG: MarC family protein [Lentisphaerae bacterium]|nr:MarC family protein [Lentisphaerota bacterium]
MWNYAWQIFENSLYFIALINPASKIFFLTAQRPQLNGKEVRHISIRASLAAFFILLGCCLGGHFVLEKIFRVQLYALQLSGGLVLLFSGMAAVQKGVFYHDSDQQKHPSYDELSIVPLAAPLIAGPGTIAATISFSMQYGTISTLLSLLPALTINLILMLTSRGISKTLEFFAFAGPVIRLTGLIVMAVAMQMMLSGASGFITGLK